MRVYNNDLELKLTTDNKYPSGWGWKCAHALDFLPCRAVYAPLVTQV